VFFSKELKSTALFRFMRPRGGRVEDQEHDQDQEQEGEQPIGNCNCGSLRQPKNDLVRSEFISEAPGQFMAAA
jgi:hypothetical protein